MNASQTQTPAAPAAEQTSIDVLSSSGNGITGSGSVAMRLLQSNMNVQSLRTNEVLHKDEWTAFDTAVVEIARARLVAVGDLMNRGLVTPLGNALGTTRIEWEQASEMTDAEITMTGLAPSERDGTDYTLKSIPIPIVHKEFKLSIRQILASRKTGEPLDTTQVRMCTRLVTERIEKLYFAGSTLKTGGGTIYGLKTFPQRNTGNLTSRWDTATGSVIVADILRMLDDLTQANMYGPFLMYLPLDYYNHLNDDYKTNSDRTIMERVRAIPGILDILPSANLVGGASGEVCMVQATSDVVDIIDGIQPTTVMWEGAGGMESNFKVMAIMVPRFKADANNQCGLLHYTV